MANIIVAPQRYIIERNEPMTIFLAGGITGCEDWQSIVIKNLEDIRDLVIFNPRRSTFDATDSSKSFEQIIWEFNCLEMMDFFTVYFAGSDSVQPITLYELGRNLVRMKERFPEDWNKRILIGIADEYKRKEDVVIQSMLAADHQQLYISGCSPEEYAIAVRKLLLSF